MTVKLAVSVINAMLDAYETAVGTSPILRLRSGAPPANAAAADTGTVLATINLGSDFMGNASAGVKAFSSTPLQDLAADAAGTVGHYRLYNSAGTTCMDQGTVTATGGGGDMEIDNTVIALGQQINVTAWSKNMSTHA